MDLSVGYFILTVGRMKMTVSTLFISISYIYLSKNQVYSLHILKSSYITTFLSVCTIQDLLEDPAIISAIDEETEFNALVVSDLLLFSLFSQSIISIFLI